MNPTEQNKALIDISVKGNLLSPERYLIYMSLNVAFSQVRFSI